MLAAVFAGALAVGLLAFCAWTVSVVVRTELGPAADPTSRLVYRMGQSVIWLAALLTAGSVFGLAAAAVVKAIGGP